LFNILTNGFHLTFLRVKESRGGKILINVRGKLQHYFITGVVEEGFLIFRDNTAKRDGRKSFKRIVIKDDRQDPFYRAINVNCINIDEELNCVIYPDNLKGVNGYDALKWSGLLTRALMKVKLSEDPVLIIVILIASILTVIGIIIVLVQLNDLKTIVELLQANTLITGGNIA